MRVYLPSTLSGLAVILRARQIKPGTAYAVTPALREAYASGDQEELEYVALTQAARASLRLLADAALAADAPNADAAAADAAAADAATAEAPNAGAPNAGAVTRGAAATDAPASGAPPRRVVLAADVDDSLVGITADADNPAQVTVTVPIATTRLVSAHVDDAQAESDIQKAIQALPEADQGDDDAAFEVDQAEGHELAWYASQELPDLVKPVKP